MVKVEIHPRCDCISNPLVSGKQGLARQTTPLCVAGGYDVGGALEGLREDLLLVEIRDEHRTNATREGCNVSKCGGEDVAASERIDRKVERSLGDLNRALCVFAQLRELGVVRSAPQPAQMGFGGDASLRQEIAGSDAQGGECLSKRCAGCFGAGVDIDWGI
jgi:hypothetical protein